MLIFLSFSIDAITVHNKTSDIIYAKTYWEKSNSATNASNIFEIEAWQSIDISRPMRKVGFDRQLYFSLKKEELADKLTQMISISSINIGLLQGNDFYIAMVQSKLEGFTLVQWSSKTTQEMIKQSKEALADAIKTAYKFTTRYLAKLYMQASNYFRTEPLLKNYPHQNEVATVRVGNNLCPQEKQYLSLRRPKTKKALEALIHKKLPEKKVPTIALVTSGGGVRAMLSTFGFLHGLQQIGLLDAVTYISCLSGSSWSIAPWMTSGWKNIRDIKAARIPELSDGLVNLNPKKLIAGSQSVRLGLANIVRKFSFAQPITTIDLYGLLLANRLLAGMGNDRQLITLSPQANSIKTGDFPMPIYTAVRAETGQEHNWYEFTPFEVGGAWLGQYVPTWAFGRTFENGQSKDFAPEQSIGYLMGIFGSIFALKFERLYKETLQQWYERADKNNFLRNMIGYIAQKIGKKQLRTLGQTQIISAELNNFTYKFGASPIKENKIIGLADAGMAFSLPFPPVSGQRPERKADIIIMLDAGRGEKTESKGLAGIINWAQKNKIPFPTINFTDIKEKSLRVFKNKNTPLILYMPVTTDKELQMQNLNKPEFAQLKPYIESFNFWQCTKETCNIFNFRYTEFQAQQLSSLVEFNVLANKENIIKEIKQYINRKR